MHIQLILIVTTARSLERTRLVDRTPDSPSADPVVDWPTVDTDSATLCGQHEVSPLWHLIGYAWEKKSGFFYIYTYICTHTHIHTYIHRHIYIFFEHDKTVLCAISRKTISYGPFTREQWRAYTIWTCLRIERLIVDPIVCFRRIEPNLKHTLNSFSRNIFQVSKEI